MRYIQLMFPVSGHQALWPLLVFILTLGIGVSIALAAPDNDLFADAAAISGEEGNQSGSTIDATAEIGEPFHYPDHPPHHSIWYQWTAPSAVEISFYTLGSSFDTVLAIYTGDSVGNLTQVASNDDDYGVLTSKVSFVPSLGTTYYIAIDGYADDDVYDENIDYGDTFLTWASVSEIVAYTLTVNQTGTGTGTVTTSGVYDEGTIQQIFATAATGSTFTGWSGDCVGTDSPLSVLMDADKTCTATFALNTHTLIVDQTGTGTGAVTGSGTYDYGTTQVISATAASGSTFTGWSSDCTGTDNPLSVLMDADKTCTATFTLNTDTRTLTVNQTGTGTGTVAGSGAYVYGTTQEIAAIAAAGSSFSGWSGDCNGTITPLSVLMDANKTCIATFTLNTHALTISKIGAGTVISTPIGIACGADCTEIYNFSTRITLTATPDTDNTFIGWSGGICTGAKECTLTIDADITVTAIFKKNFPWQIFLPVIMNMNNTQ